MSKTHIEEAERVARTAKVPTGWTIEPMTGAGFVVVTAIDEAQSVATIDVGARVVRIGRYVTHGEVACVGIRPVGGVPRGRGWQQKLIHAAVEKLREVAG